jgi:hypothetical protein
VGGGPCALGPVGLSDPQPTAQTAKAAAIAGATNAEMADVFMAGSLADELDVESRRRSDDPLHELSLCL